MSDLGVLPLKSTSLPVSKSSKRPDWKMRALMMVLLSSGWPRRALQCIRWALSSEQIVGARDIYFESGNCVCKCGTLVGTRHVDARD